MGGSRTTYEEFAWDFLGHIMQWCISQEVNDIMFVCFEESWCYDHFKKNITYYIRTLFVGKKVIFNW